VGGEQPAEKFEEDGVGALGETYKGRRAKKVGNRPRWQKDLKDRKQRPAQKRQRGGERRDGGQSKIVDELGLLRRPAETQEGLGPKKRVK